LDKVDVKVKAVVTVATPFAATVPVEELIGFFDHMVEWRRLRRRAKQFVTIQSKNDPLVPYDHARRYQEILKSRIVLTPKDSHFIGKQAKVVWREVKRLADGE
jgi:predicted alpha/beta hydrolase family esterase